MLEELKKMLVAIEKKRSLDWKKMVSAIYKLNEAVKEVSEQNSILSESVGEISKQNKVLAKQNRILRERIATMANGLIKEDAKPVAKKVQHKKVQRSRSVIDTGDAAINEILNKTAPLPSDGPGVISSEEKVPTKTLDAMGIMKDYREVMKAIDVKQNNKRNAGQ